MSPEVTPLPQALISRIATNPGPARQAEVEMLLELARDHESWGLPERWLLTTALALQEDDWGGLAEGFRNEEFLGAGGQLLIVGPYSVNREGRVAVALSAVYGSLIDHPELPDLYDVVREIFGECRQPVSKILPLICHASCGNIGSEAGEAFIVPDGWEFLRSGEGPALNDIGEQRRRFEEGGAACIRTIFDSATADLLLDIYQTPAEQMILQHEEYQLHEAGHASGIGLTRKISENLLPTWWHGAVEEWRSDGVAFEVAGRILGEENAGRLVASNFCTRFGVDAHRLGGPDRDRDVAASLLTLDQALRVGAFKLHKGKLALQDPSFRGLFAATALHRLNAVSLTREEMALDEETGVRRRYDAVPVEADSRMIFEGVVREGCRGIFRELR